MKFLYELISFWECFYLSNEIKYAFDMVQVLGNELSNLKSSNLHEHILCTYFQKNLLFYIKLKIWYVSENILIVFVNLVLEQKRNCL